MTENNNIRECEKIAREIEKMSESIRKKHRALKTDKIEDDIAVKTRFKPIIEPLQKIVDSPSMRAIKDEPELPNDDDDVKTLSVQKREEEDAKLSKRKQSNTFGSQIETLGRSWTGCVTDNFHTIRDNRKSNNARVTRKRGCFRNHGRLARGIYSKSVANAGGSENVERNVVRTLGSAESKVRWSYFDRIERAIWTACTVFILTRME